MSARNQYLVQLHGRPRAVTNVRIGDKFVYVGPVDGHVLYSGDEEPCPPGIILTLTNRVEKRPAVGSGASKLIYQLCSSELSPRSAARYDMSSFERWMYAKALANMINRCQLKKVQGVSHQEAFGSPRRTPVDETFPDTPMDTPTPRPTPRPTPTPTPTPNYTIM